MIVLFETGEIVQCSRGGDCRATEAKKLPNQRFGFYIYIKRAGGTELSHTEWEVCLTASESGSIFLFDCKNFIPLFVNFGPVSVRRVCSGLVQAGSYCIDGRPPAWILNVA